MWIDMMWSPNHFPSAMRSLTPSVRAKAIEFANELLDQGELTKQDVVSISIYKARSWARRRLAETPEMNVPFQPQV